MSVFHAEFYAIVNGLLTPRDWERDIRTAKSFGTIVFSIGLTIRLEHRETLNERKIVSIRTLLHGCG